MATEDNGHSTPDPKLVGTNFADQYYKIIHSSPEYGYRFYQDDSELLWPGPDGQVTPVSTIQGINEMILSLDYKHCKITSVDAQASYKDGVLVLVTGQLTAKENIVKTFTQTFFLAPQKNGYYVLTDILRYVNNEALSPAATTDDVVDITIADEPVTPDTEPTQVSVEPEQNDVLSEESVPNGTEVVVVPEETEVIVVPNRTEVVVENGVDSAAAKIEVVANSATEQLPKDVPPAAVIPSSVPQGDTPKKSYASIVNALKNSNGPSWQVRASPAKVAEKPSVRTTKEAPVVEKISTQQVKRYSVFVGNLPLESTVEQIEAAFKRFGPIKSEGIQVRTSKGSCYGFVEFESESSMRLALEEGSVPVGSRKANIEEQKNDSNSDRGRFTQGRGGYRGGGEGGGFRGRGGGRGYGRSDPDRKFDSFPRGPRNGGGGGAYNRDFQNGSGRGSRPVVKETAVVKN